MTTLTEELAQANTTNREAIDDAALAVLDRATEELRLSGLAEASLAVGATMPDFELPNARGEVVRLADLRAKGPVVVSFYRGGWCPYCSLELRALQRCLSHFEERGASLVAISAEPPDHSLSTKEKNELAFEVLTDGEHALARELGLVFPLQPELRDIYLAWRLDLPARTGGQWELPIPATYVVDTDGTVLYRFADADYTKRLDPEDILDALG